jgi:hypothetical protein
LPTIHSAQAPNANLGPGQGACKIHPPQTDASYPIPFTVPPEIAAADDCYNGFNIFAMTISSPKQTYYLNYTTDYDGVDRQPAGLADVSGYPVLLRELAARGWSRPELEALTGRNVLRVLRAAEEAATEPLWPTAPLR